MDKNKIKFSDGELTLDMDKCVERVEYLLEHIYDNLDEVDQLAFGACSITALRSLGLTRDEILNIMSCVNGGTFCKDEDESIVFDCIIEYVDNLLDQVRNDIKDGSTLDKLIDARYEEPEFVQ